MNDLTIVLDLIGWIFILFPVAVIAAVLIVGFWGIVITLLDECIQILFK